MEIFVTSYLVSPTRLYLILFSESARAVGLVISFTAAGIVLGFTALALSLPITIAGLGVRDGMLIWMLATFGFTVIGKAIALSTCLLGISLFWAFAGGVAFFWPIADTQASNNISA